MDAVYTLDGVDTLKRSGFAFAGVSESLVVEVPKSAVLEYKQVFFQINKKLAEKVVGYEK